MLDVLKKEKLYLKLSKCEIGKTSLIYLGHIVGNGKLRIAPFKVEAIMKWPEPTNVTKVRSFLSAVQYWRRFIANFSIIASPLHALTSVKQDFQWGGKQQKSFDTLKEKINMAPVLALPELQQPFDNFTYFYYFYNLLLYIFIQNSNLLFSILFIYYDYILFIIYYLFNIIIFSLLFIIYLLLLYFLYLFTIIIFSLFFIIYLLIF